MLMLAIGVLVTAVIWLAVVQWEHNYRHEGLVKQVAALRITLGLQDDDFKGLNRAIREINPKLAALLEGNSNCSLKDLNERLTAFENAQSAVITGTLEYLSPALACEPKKVYHKDNKGRFAKKPA